MSQFTCGNHGRCSFADGQNRFSWSGSGSPICPGCGRTDYVSPEGSRKVGLNPKFVAFGIVGLIILIVAFLVVRSSGTQPPPKPTVKLVPSEPNPKQEPRDQNIPNPEASEPKANPLPIAIPELFGLIEIGGKGVKGLVVDLVQAENNPDCQSSEETFAECVMRGVQKQFDPFDVNPIEKGAIVDTAKAVKVFFDEMVRNFSVDPRQIYLVASSSISEVPHRNELREAVEHDLNKPGEMTFLTPEQEGRYGYEGVLNLIPKQWREKRRRQAVLIDVGSGNTKGGFLNVYDGAPDDAFVPISFPWGTKSFFKEVDSRRGATNFQEFSADLRIRLLRPVIRDEISRKQAVANRTRVYLIGGISWATSILTDPQSKLHFPPLTSEKFDILYRRAIQPEAVTQLCDENPMRAYTKDIDKVCKAFNMNELTAGLEILKTLSEELDFPNKQVFFIRDSLYAWPLGYLKQRCRDEGKC